MIAPTTRTVALTGRRLAEAFERMSKYRKGVFHLPVGEGVGTRLPVCGHSETPTFFLTQRDQSPVHTGEMSRSLVRQSEQDPDKKCADGKLAGPDARREKFFQIGHTSERRR